LAVSGSSAYGCLRSASGRSFGVGDGCLDDSYPIDSHRLKVKIIAHP
jgi:hypothetical protein